MSGEDWYGDEQKIRQEVEHVKSWLDLEALIHHAMNWALSGDSCEACGRLRVWAALKSYFHSYSGNEEEVARSAIILTELGPVCEKHGEGKASGRVVPAGTMYYEGRISSETFRVQCSCGKKHDVPVWYVNAKEPPAAWYERWPVEIDLPCPVSMGNRVRAMIECPKEVNVRLPTLPLGE